MDHAEKEKMLSSRHYYMYDEVLSREYKERQPLLRRFNDLSLSKQDRDVAFKALIPTQGVSCHIHLPFYCDHGTYIQLGDRVFLNSNVCILDCSFVRIGSDTMIGPLVGIYSAGHPIEPELRLKHTGHARPVTIGKNVWVGGSASILGGVTIGDHTVVGAGSVVVRNLPACCVAVGNPARIVKLLEAPPGYELSEEDRLLHAKFRADGSRETSTAASPCGTMASFLLTALVVLVAILLYYGE